MADYNLNSFASQVEVLMATRADFPQKLKQRLALELKKMENHFEFIGGLVSNGVLCDWLTDSEAGSGMKELMAQLAIMIACTQGADTIGGLVKTLEESGNPQLVTALQTWVKEDSGIENGGDLHVDLCQGKGDTSAVHNPASELLTQQVKSTVELSSSGTKLIDKVISNIEKELIEQLEGHLVGKASKIVNSSEFRSNLVHLNVVDESNVKLKSAPELQEAEFTERAIKLACSKGAIGSLILALQASNNEHVLKETLEWLESSQPRKKNYPISVKSLAIQRNTEESKTLLRPRFCDQLALPDRLSKLATFQCPQKSSTKGITALQFDKERMMALAADGTLYVWNLGGGEEEPIAIKIPAEKENVTCFQFDEEILVVGTGGGHIYLFDARTLEVKSTIWFGQETVTSLKFFESTLVVITLEDGICVEVYWIDISRPDKRFLNQRDLDIGWARGENQVPGICMYPDMTFLYTCAFAPVYDTKSGDPILDENQQPCSLWAPNDISTLSVGHLVSFKRVVVAGCYYGMIGLWNTSKLMLNTNPLKVVFGHNCETIVGVCTVGGHLLSLDKSGKLLMWSGYDLDNEKFPIPLKRVLAETSPSVSNLAAYERWFASGSSEDGSVNIWTLPDLWLCAG